MRGTGRATAASSARTARRECATAPARAARGARDTAGPVPATRFVEGMGGACGVRLRREPPPQAVRAQHAANAQLSLRETRLVKGMGGAADGFTACGYASLLRAATASSARTARCMRSARRGSSPAREVRSGVLTGVRRAASALAVPHGRAHACAAGARAGGQAGRKSPPQIARARHVANAQLSLHALHAERATRLVEGPGGTLRRAAVAQAVSRAPLVLAPAGPSASSTTRDLFGIIEGLQSELFPSLIIVELTRDRLALAFLVQLSANPGVRATVVWICKVQSTADEKEKEGGLSARHAGTTHLIHHDRPRHRVRRAQHADAAPHTPGVAAALSRVMFAKQAAAAPLHRIVELVELESAKLAAGKNLMVLLGRSRRMAVEPHNISGLRGTQRRRISWLSSLT
ncbi:hypothetical protein B0H15DRAFT_952307 [Mycena belliarum]|uniref:Uncharacterized protein n=1 Tax=Mycena belliarum TaxID=1033014 RepID=A0AAD6U1S6_9AGAR|nr:hypothetical protein B0H15DRAFT_952307 [Mycena belliae]